jgi:RHS repeat-associated protein
MRRRSLLALAVVLFAVAAAVPTVALGGDTTTVPDGDPATEGIPITEPAPDEPGLDPMPPTDSTPPDPEPPNLDTEEAQAERDDSEQAYADDNAAESQDLLEEEFGPEISALDDESARAIEPSSVEEFFSDQTARVDPPGEEGPRVVLSSLPLRTENEDGKLAPVDLDLSQDDGGTYQPKNPLAEVSLPAEANAPVRLEGADIGIRLLSDVAGDSGASVVDGDKLFYHEAAKDTDLTIAPVARGAELFAQIRSIEAPERLSFHVSLPPGADLRDAGPTGLEVVRDDKRAALISPPEATDAQGASVDVETILTGPDSFDLVVPHQQQDLAYPILVDPIYEDWYGSSSWNQGNLNGLDSGVWTASGNTAGGSGYYNQTSAIWPNWNFGRGLYLGAPAGWHYPVGDFGQWAYTAPGQTTYITGAEFGPLNFLNPDANHDTPYPYWGLWSPTTGEAGGWGDGEIGDAGYALGTGLTQYLGPCSRCSFGAVPEDEAKVVVFGLNSWYDHWIPGWVNKQAYLGGIWIELDDPEPPSLSVSSTSGWVQTLPFSASDPGLGVQEVAVFDAGTEDPLGGWKDSCTGVSGRLCPPSVNTTIQDVDEGRHNVFVKAYDPTSEDPAENVTFSQQIEIKIDRSRPEIKLDGPLVEAAATGDLNEGSYGLDVLARDGSRDDRSNERSGVRELKLLLDDNPIPGGANVGDCTDPQGSCEKSLHYDLDTSLLAQIGNPDPAHQYTLKIQATDQAGNPTASKEIKFTVHHLPGVITSPKKGDSSARRFTIDSERHDPRYTGVTYQYQAPGSQSWQTIPLGNLQLASGSSPSAYPLTLDSTSGKAPSVTWDVASTPGMTDGKVNIQANFNTGPPSDVLLGDSPSLYWRLGESSGTSAADSSAVNHPGSYVGSPSLHQSGALPTAFDDGAVGLSGAGQYLSSTYAPFANATSRTYEGWAYRNSSTTLDVLFSSSAAASVAPRLQLAANSNNVTFQPGGAGGTTTTWSNAWPGNAQWVHWTLVFNEPTDTLDLYINGALVSSKTNATPYNAAPGNFAVGGVGGAGNPFDGRFDEVAVYERGLSGAEVQRHYQGYAEGYSQTVPVTFDRDSTTAKHASAPVGPGSVDLLTGNYALTADDVSIQGFGSDLTVSRTFNSRKPADGPGGPLGPGTLSPLGPGWIPSVPIDAAGSDYVKLTETGTTPQPGADAVVKVTESDGTEILFTKVGEDYETEPLYKDLTLSHSGLGYALKDLDGNVVTFAKPTNAADFYPVKIDQPGSSSKQTTTNLKYEVIDAYGSRVPRVTLAMAPAPHGALSCLADNGTLANNGQVPAGCRALRFVYTPLTASPPAAGQFGAYPTRLAEIRFHSAETGADGIQVARYNYDSNGRLHAEWDPRVGTTSSCGGACAALVTTYTYGADGRVTSMRPVQGENPWTFTYTSTSTDPNGGRIKRVQRAIPTGGTATNNVVYDVPLAGGSGIPTMTASAVASWGQTDVPADATAVFPEDAAPTEYDKATIYYLNRNGDQVNVASPGDDITTTEYEEHRQVRRTLTAQNRAVALASPDPAQTAAELDTQSIYASKGLELVDQLGPAHSVQLTPTSSVTARQHTVTSYDENAPMGEDYHLPTTVQVGAQVTVGQPDQNVRTTKTDYNWFLRQPTVETIDPNGLNIKTITHYNNISGLAIASQTPKGNGTATTIGTGAYTTKTEYYTADGTSTFSGCRNNPEWANLPCFVYPAGQPTGSSAPPLNGVGYEYDKWGNVTSQKDFGPGNPTSQQDYGPGGGFNTLLRTTTTTFDDAGRPVLAQMTGGQGTAVPAVTTTYSSDTGRVAETSAPGQGTIARIYDSIGRLTQYHDGNGGRRDFSYDGRNRMIGWVDWSSSFQVGWQTIGHDPVTGRESAMEDSHLGSFSATYNADGQLTSESMPNGLDLSMGYDSTGNPTVRSYTHNGSPLMSFTEGSSIHGQVTRSLSALNGATTETELEFYDAAGRLTQSRDTQAGGCTVETYQYDKDSNRQKLWSKGPSPTCDTSAGTPTATQTYDQADRLIDTGYAYDGFGRTTHVPAVDAGGSELYATYFVDGRIRSLTQGGVAKTFSGDPLGRISVTETSGQSDEILHYSDQSDEPTWTQKGSIWTRFSPDLTGDLCSIQQGTAPMMGNSVTYELTNIHGDVVSEADEQGQLTGSFDTDDFGVPTGNLPSSGNGYLGGKQRESQFSSGAITMGQRVYVPQIGRFLQTDPVAGGSANDYDYVNQDPLNQLDLSGAKPAGHGPASAIAMWCRRHHCHGGLPKLPSLPGAPGHAFCSLSHFGPHCGFQFNRSTSRKIFKALAVGASASAASLICTTIAAIPQFALSCDIVIGTALHELGGAVARSLNHDKCRFEVGVFLPTLIPRYVKAAECRSGSHPPVLF